VNRNTYGGRLVENLVQTAALGLRLANGPDESEELEQTQEIARTAFEPDPLEATQPIYPNHVMSGTWEWKTLPTVHGGEFKTYERYRK